MNKKYLKHVLLCSIGYFVTACSSGNGSNGASNNYNYPQTATVNVSTDYFGTIINDPYQWLESTTEPNVLYWVDQQNSFTQDYFNKIPDYSNILAQVTQIYSKPPQIQSLDFKTQEKTMVDGKNGKYFYILNKTTEYNDTKPVFRNKNITQSVDNIIYVTTDKNKQGEVFLDINSLYPNDVINTRQIATFGNNQYLVYSLVRNYGDIADLHVIDIPSKKEISVIPNAFGNVTVWESGFFYIQPSNITNPLISSYNYDKLNYLSIANNIVDTKTIYTGDDKQFIMVNYIAESTAKLYFSASIDENNQLYKVDLSNDNWVANIFINDEYQHSYNILDSSADESTLYIKTNNGARAFRVISVDANNSDASSWQNILPELGSEKIIRDILICNNKYVSLDIENGLNKISQYDFSGAFERNIPLPENMAVSEGNVKCGVTNEVNIAYSNMVTPLVLMKYNFVTEQESIYETTTIPTYNPTDYTMYHVTVPSTNNVMVDVFLAYKNGLQLDGNNPTYIDVYGGFDLPMDPVFSKRAVYFMENGGIYAVAQVRGGGDKGNNWYNDGRLFNKQNTYNDTIAVAEYLIQHGYTNPSKLGLGGRSNGGLTTAATVVQRPDLFKVAFPAVGVHDLLRYNQFTLGFTWYFDYGYSSIQEQFNNMMKFAPLVNIKAQSYPAMYIQTGQEDTRVPPLHSYKLAATLQNVATGPNPYLLDSYPNMSHFPQGGTDIIEAAKTWAFFFYNTNTPLSQ